MSERGLARARLEEAAEAGRAPSFGRRTRAGLQENVISVVSALALLGVWEALVRAGLLDRRFFSAPSDVLRALFRLLVSGGLLADVGITLERLAIGFAIGAVAGVALGLLMGTSRLVRAAMKPVVGAVYPIPKIAILPLVMLVFGLGDASRYAIVAIGVFFLVLLNAMAGVMAIEPIYLDVGRNFGAKRIDVLRTIALPGALPLVFTGLRLGWGTGFLLVVAAEFLSARSGLGYEIWNSWQTFSVEEMYAGLLVISALGLISFALIDVIERWVVPWRPEGP